MNDAGMANQNQQDAVQQKDAVRQNEQKWTPDVWGAGWIGIPSIVIENQHRLDLTPTDITILLHLIKHWWRKDELPHPSKRRIATCMGVDVSTVRRRLSRMEKMGVLKRIPRFAANSKSQTSNRYDFSGLIGKLAPLAQEATAIKKQRREEDERRLRRRAAGSTIVPTGGQQL